jgi:hypothetical protein
LLLTQFHNQPNPEFPFWHTLRLNSPRFILNMS